MTLLHTIASGIIEGLTEFLPVSSTAHLILVDRFFGTTPDSFLVFIQVGAVLAVVTEYLRKLSLIRRLIVPISVSFCVTAIIGLMVYPVVRGFLLESLLVIAIALIIGGIIIVFFDRRLMAGSRSISEMGIADGIAIGLAQAVAVIPGVSRSYATILGAGMRGLSRVTAVEYSFLLSVPTIIAAAGYDIYKQGFGQVFAGGYGVPLLGFVVSWVVASVCIRVFLRYVATYDLRIFGWYRIVVGVGILVYLIMI